MTIEVPTAPPGTSRRPQFHYKPADVSASPAVAVITPFFNTGAIFEETCASLFAQSFQQWEWIIVNDASDDPAALAVLDSVRDIESHVCVVDLTERRGPSVARNMAVRHAQAPYLLFLDSDDLIEPTALEKMFWCLESHPEWAMCKGYTVAFGEQSYLSTAGFEEPWLFLDRNPVTITALVRRKTFQAVGGFDESMRSGLEDWDLWLNLAANGYWGHTIPELLDWYRRRHSHHDRWHLWSGTGVSKVRRQLQSTYPDLYQQGIKLIPEHSFEPSAPLDESIDFSNILKLGPRLLLLLQPPDSTASVGGIAKKCAHLQDQGYQVTVVFLGAVESALLQLTPEVFVLANFLAPGDYVRFLLYLIGSRRFERVVLGKGTLPLNLGPVLQLHYPDLLLNRFDGSPYDSLGVNFRNNGTKMEEPVACCAERARELARIVIHCCELKRQLRKCSRAVPLDARLYQFLVEWGRLGIKLLLLKERLWLLGHAIKERLFTKGRGSSANSPGSS